MNFFNTLSENTDKVGGGSRLLASNETSAVIHYLQNIYWLIVLHVNVLLWLSYLKGSILQNCYCLCYT